MYPMFPWSLANRIVVHRASLQQQASANCAAVPFHDILIPDRTCTLPSISDPPVLLLSGAFFCRVYPDLCVFQVYKRLKTLN
jgi:hypothetical protein